MRHLVYVKHKIWNLFFFIYIFWGCYGPNPDNTMVTVEQCRELYSGCADGGLDEDFTVGGETVSYRRKEFLHCVQQIC